MVLLKHMLVCQKNGSTTRLIPPKSIAPKRPLLPKPITPKDLKKSLLNSKNQDLSQTQKDILAEIKLQNSQKPKSKKLSPEGRLKKKARSHKKVKTCVEGDVALEKNEVEINSTDDGLIHSKEKEGGTFRLLIIRFIIKALITTCDIVSEHFI